MARGAMMRESEKLTPLEKDTIYRAGRCGGIIIQKSTRYKDKYYFKDGGEANRDVVLRLVKWNLLKIESDGLMDGLGQTAVVK